MVCLVALVFEGEDPAMSRHAAAMLSDDFIAAYDANDPRLIEHMRKHYVELPNQDISLTLEHPELDDSSQFGQSKRAAQLMNNKRNGIFLEVGAFDGETYANSLYFERFLNWTGLLIEADPVNIELLQRRHRNAVVFKGCVGDASIRPAKRQFFAASYLGGLSEHLSPIRRVLTRLWRSARYFDVWCFPMSSILAATGIDRIDYAIIDVEGPEMLILNAIDWEQAGIDLLQVEFAIFQGAFFDKARSEAKKTEIEKFVKTRMPGYAVVDYTKFDVIIRKSMSVD